MDTRNYSVVSLLLLILVISAECYPTSSSFDKKSERKDQYEIKAAIIKSARTDFITGDRKEQRVEYMSTNSELPKNKRLPENKTLKESKAGVFGKKTDLIHNDEHLSDLIAKATKNKHQVNEQVLMLRKPTPASKVNLVDIDVFRRLFYLQLMRRNGIDFNNLGRPLIDDTIDKLYKMKLGSKYPKIAFEILDGQSLLDLMLNQQQGENIKYQENQVKPTDTMVTLSPSANNGWSSIVSSEYSSNIFPDIISTSIQDQILPSASFTSTQEINLISSNLPELFSSEIDISYSTGVNLPSESTLSTNIVDTNIVDIDFNNIQSSDPILFTRTPVLSSIYNEVTSSDSIISPTTVLDTTVKNSDILITTELKIEPTKQTVTDFTQLSQFNGAIGSSFTINHPNQVHMRSLGRMAATKDHSENQAVAADFKSSKTSNYPPKYVHTHDEFYGDNLVANQYHIVKPTDKLRLRMKTGRNLLETDNVQNEKPISSPTKSNVLNGETIDPNTLLLIGTPKRNSKDTTIVHNIETITQAGNTPYDGFPTTDVQQTTQPNSQEQSFPKVTLPVQRTKSGNGTMQDPLVIRPTSQSLSVQNHRRPTTKSATQFAGPTLPKPPLINLDIQQQKINHSSDTINFEGETNTIGTTKKTNSELGSSLDTKLARPESISISTQTDKHPSLNFNTFQRSLANTQTILNTATTEHSTTKHPSRHQVITLPSIQEEIAIRPTTSNNFVRPITRAEQQMSPLPTTTTRPTTTTTTTTTTTVRPTTTPPPTTTKFDWCTFLCKVMKRCSPACSGHFTSWNR